MSNEAEFNAMQAKYYAVFGDIFPMMSFRHLSLQDAIDVMRDCIEKGQPAQLGDDPDVLY